MQLAKKSLIKWLSLLVVLLVVLSLVWYFKGKTFTGIGGCLIDDGRGEEITLEAAQSVADKFVRSEETGGLRWLSLGHYPIYNSDGDISYHAFLFNRSGYSVTSLNSLELNASKYDDSVAGGGDNKYQFNNIYTIWTGAVNTDETIIRHYHGMPEIVGKKIEIKKFVENKYSGMTIGNIVANSPMSQMYFQIVSKSDGRATGDLVGLDYSIVPASRLSSDVARSKAQNARNYGGERCESYTKLLRERNTYLENKWSGILGK